MFIASEISESAPGIRERMDKMEVKGPEHNATIDCIKTDNWFSLIINSDNTGDRDG